MDVRRSSGRRRPAWYFSTNKINGFRSSSDIRDDSFCVRTRKKAIVAGQKNDYTYTYI